VARRTVFLAFVSLILLLVVFEDCSIGTSRTWSGSLQEAIDAANPGDIIRVPSGTYYEHLVVTKSLTLIGEGNATTIIDGNGTGTVMTVKASSVYISGFTIQRGGDEQPGVLLDHVTNSTIEGNRISDNNYGIFLSNSEKNTIKDNFVNGNMWGIFLEDSRNIVIRSNTISNNYRRAVNLDSSDNNIIDENIVKDHVQGIYLTSSSNNLLQNNNLTGNTYGFGVFGSELAHFIQNMDDSNLIDGKPILYWVNQHDKQIQADASYIAVVNSTGITVKDLKLTHHQEGPLFAYTVNSTIENMYISNAKCGLRLISCEGFKMTDNMLSGNAKGLRLDYSVNNIIKRNIITENHEGIFLDNSRDNIIAGNTMSDNIRGMFVYYSIHNIIHHNNFINNEKHVFIALHRIIVINVWEMNSEGNYWSDHAGSDLDEDGIGSDPYILDTLNQDNHPLMGLFYDFTVTREETSEHVAATSNSTISNFNFSEGVISFDVANADLTTGFCRVTIPLSLLDRPYEVLVDGSPPLALKELASSNSTHAILYFTYEHSTRKVIIVPEYSLVTLLLFTLVTLAITAVHWPSRTRKSVTNEISEDSLWKPKA